MTPSPFPAVIRAALAAAAAERGLAPEPWPEDESWDSEDSNAYQDRIEAGLEPAWPDD